MFYAVPGKRADCCTFQTTGAQCSRCFRELATGELNKPAAIGKVTKILRKMEGAAPDVCPDRAINGDCGQLLAEDRAKAEAFVRTYAHVSRNVRQPKRDRIVKTELRGLKAAPCCCRGQRTDQFHRTATRQWRENWPDSFFKTIFGSTLPLPIPGEDREAAISVHQLRAGHWGRSLQYLHRIGRHPSVACLQCPDKRCPAALCAVCREEADVPEHVLLRCPALAGARLRLTGSIYVDPSRLRDADLGGCLGGRLPSS
ncbi:hypothetical protein FJT64_014257 [Amphibalanus amphitrite]|uniref:Uncharacterized protein n=1 Tax=Amphibalanus amphitrite TaxID=1232801 RepID=A0A6A4V114_AMPAM|nr:hypothetical protein FJT64_014257 [Amphibalanus amphitrite]